MAPDGSWEFHQLNWRKLLESVFKPVRPLRSRRRILLVRGLRGRRGPYRPPPRKICILCESLQICYNKLWYFGCQKTIKVLHRGGGKAGGQILSGASKTQAGREKKNPQSVESADGDTVDNRFWAPKNPAAEPKKLADRPEAPWHAGGGRRFSAGRGGVFPIPSQGYPRIIHRRGSPKSQSRQGFAELSTLSTAPTTITVYIDSATTLE